MKILIKISILMVLLFSISGCSKYLESKSDQSLVIINTLDDMQAIINEYSRLNSTLSADITSADEYYLTWTDFQGLYNEFDRNKYIWNPTFLWGEYTALVNDWGLIYNNIYIANTVLANINKVKRTAENSEKWDSVKGQAHFLRAFSLLKGAEVFCLAYDEKTSDNDLGLPLRLDPDINLPSVRSSVKETYKQILSDAQLAADLLPFSSPHVFRSSKISAHGLLARTYLSMRNYEKALNSAENYLKLSSNLIDYNSLDQTPDFPIPQYNKEVIYHVATASSTTYISIAKIDSSLLALYEESDLRKKIFYGKNSDDSYFLKGNYTGSDNLFAGLATDEMYLIRAECLARQGNLTEAMKVLNTLLVNRYKKGTFIPLALNDSSEALSVILKERRKELVMRGTRWMDIKRLNKEGYNISLTRHLNGKIYTLPAGDLRFALPIPDDIIQRSGMPQNPR